MKATGIVVEYNPFHNGHLHHAAQAREISGADAVIAVMSGQFLQRGEPAFTDKWTRTRMALAGGVDLVVELPYVFSTAQAAEFAKGALAILDAVRCESFVFGSEQGDIGPFLRTFDFLASRRGEYEAEISRAIRTGISYPKAMNDAYASVTKGDAAFADLTKPNNILGYHYVEAAKRLGSPIRPLTIKRLGAGYHDPLSPSEQIASATGIRKAVSDGAEPDELTGFLPTASLDELVRFHSEYGCFGGWPAFYPMLRTSLLRDRPQRLADYAEVAEGIEHLLADAAVSAETFASFMNTVKSKRYTWTRIQRMLTHILTGFTWEELRRFELPEYVRILGMTAKGRSYLNTYKKEIGLPIISRAADLRSGMGAVDLHASRIYLAGIGETDLKKEFRMPPIYAG
ncbi:nucleotidyltransferase [Indiicoccus explosivorum]|uniref:nucleotidyltransferase n=1 Tax=Indiicoccus explosivorum TaxID=1917864 RepID=UPI000B43D6DB|nr:nucleotidyltransferase [Indiicoccus explosivorum]